MNDRAKDILHFVIDYSLLNQRPPTIREIGEACGISSTSMVRRYLIELEDEGFIMRLEGSRGIKVL